MKLRKYVKSLGGEVDVFLAGCKYGIRIAQTVSAIEKTTGYRVPWHRAFGTKGVIDILNSMKIEKIVFRVDGEEKVYRSLRDLVLETG